MVAVAVRDENEVCVTEGKAELNEVAVLQRSRILMWTSSVNSVGSLLGVSAGLEVM